MKKKITARHMTVIAICLSLYLLLKFVVHPFVLIPNILQVNVIVVIMPLIGMLCGRTSGFVIGVLADLIYAFFFPPPVFNIVFTLSEGLLGFLGGYLLFRKNLDFLPVLISSIIICYLGIVLANTLALVVQYTLLTFNVTQVQKVLALSLLWRFVNSTLIYIPLLTAIIYLPRKQWTYLMGKAA